MIDISDGLSSDLFHLCRESGVGARIFAENIPVDKSLKRFLTQRRKGTEKESGPQRRRDAETKVKKDLSPSSAFPFSLSSVLNGGEDFELLFTTNPKKNFVLEKELRNFPFTCIGEITKSANKIELILNSETTILKPEGFRHF